MDSGFNRFSRKLVVLAFMSAHDTVKFYRQLKLANPPQFFIGMEKYLRENKILLA